MEAGGIDVLCRTKKHKDENIRSKTIIAAGFLFSRKLKQMKKLRRSGCFETLVELISTDESWDIKENAIKTLGHLALHYASRRRVCEAGGITAILSHLREDSPGYMQTVYKTLYFLVLGMSSAYYHPYLIEVAH